MVSADTTVTVTMGKLITGIVGVGVILGGVLWTVLTFTIGGVRDDVSAIRQSVIALQAADRDNINRTNEVNTKLTEQIQGLRVDLVKFTDKMDGFSGKFDNMNKSIDALGGRIDKLQAGNDYLIKTVIDRFGPAARGDK